MGKSLDEKLASLSPERRARVAARTAELIAEEKSLSELRRARAHSEELGEEARSWPGEHFQVGKP